MAFLGVALDHEKNGAAGGDASIGADDARVEALVIESREDVEIAVRCAACCAGAGRAEPPLRTRLG